MQRRQKNEKKRKEKETQHPHPPPPSHPQQPFPNTILPIRPMCHIRPICLKYPIPRHRVSTPFSHCCKMLNTRTHTHANVNTPDLSISTAIFAYSERVCSCGSDLVSVEWTRFCMYVCVCMCVCVPGVWQVCDRCVAAEAAAVCQIAKP